MNNNQLLGVVFANNVVVVFMYSLCGLDLGGLWWAVYVCRQRREGDRAHRNIAKLSLLHYPTDAQCCPTYLLLIQKQGSLRAQIAPNLLLYL